MNYKSKLHDIKAFVFDFDGVMTDGSVWTMFNGDTVRAGNIKDGFALQYAKKKGYITAVLSGATSLSIYNRMVALGTAPDDIMTGCADKTVAFEKFLKRHNLSEKQVLYMGDDLPDFHIMQRAGVATCPSDAAEEIKQIADYISIHPGGKGCVRDVIEQTLRLHGNWFHPDAVVW